MSDTVITVENLCKKYTIGHQKQARYETFRENLNHMGRGMLQRLKHPLSTNKENIDLEEFWALQDLNFEIERGDRVGIIGRNGAGKSTLLKILSRITEPTSGKITIRGRVASLLEVGTGFHPELTGRENIFLNGAILGMSRAEIKKKFDEIVDFSGVEKFLDTPVKRYSSGMYVRLAFAVAAHLEPEILIVDEVLAVGDSAFQKKCLGKMEDVGREGRTVLFVSHNMRAVQQLTGRSILLNDGKLVLDDATSKVVESYCEKSSILEISTELKTRMVGFRIDSIKFNSDSLESGFNKPLRFELALSLEKNMQDVNFGLGIYNSIGGRIVTSRYIVDELSRGKTNLSVIISDHHLPPGNYTLAIGISAQGSMIIYEENVFSFELSDVNVDEPYLIPYLSSHRDRIGTFIPGVWEKEIRA